MHGAAGRHERLPVLFFLFSLFIQQQRAEHQAARPWRVSVRRRRRRAFIYSFRE